MDVSALDSAVIVAPGLDPSQSQNRTNNPSPDASGIAAASSVAGSSTPPSVQSQSNVAPTRPVTAPKPVTSPVHSAASTSAPSTSIHVAYRFVQNPVQVVVVFTDAADGQQVAQVPPEFVVKLVQFDHDKGELVDRDA